MYRLMLVEDEALVRGSMLENTRWEQLGFEVVSACADGREAIGQLNQVVPDVVITDIGMPHVDGIQLAGYIRTYFHQVLVVLLTGYGEFEYARSALKLQVFDYVLKPILPKQFDALLLREEPWQEPSELPHLELARQELLRQVDRAASAASGDEEPVERAERYIQAHYRDYQFSQSELLEHLGVSKSYFCALFKSAKGASFTEYLTGLRIEEAKKLLRTTNLYNGEIAARVGFLDANYFSMTFKRLEGVTPRQYRKEHT